MPTMKKVAKINPEQEYDNIKSIVTMGDVTEVLGLDRVNGLNTSLENLFTAVKVLIERLDKRNEKFPGKKKLLAEVSAKRIEIERILANYHQ